MTAIRPARVNEAGAIARIEVETWRASYPGILSERVLVGMSEERQTLSWTRTLQAGGEIVLVASDRGIVVGFASAGARRHATDEIPAEIYTLYVTPDAQNRGLGRRLLRGCFTRLVASGHRGALVWVLRDNPSRFFYQRLGGKPVMHRAIPVGGQPVEAVAYGWPDLAATLALPSLRGVDNA